MHITVALPRTTISLKRTTIHHKNDTRGGGSAILGVGRGGLFGHRGGMLSDSLASCVSDMDGDCSPVQYYYVLRAVIVHLVLINHRAVHRGNPGTESEGHPRHPHSQDWHS
jgi:hypothetical protein